MTDIANILVDTIGLGTGMLWLLLIGLAVGGKRLQRALAIVAFLLAMPMTSFLAALPLDAATHTVDEIDTLKPADAVVVFGAGVFADDLGGMWPSSHSIRRATAGHEISRALKIPLVVSGGVARPGLGAEAQIIARILSLPESSIIEDRARNTLENAAFVADIAGNEGWRSVILVTSTRHTRRASAALRSTGLSVSAVVGVIAEPEFGIWDVVPSLDGLGRWKPILHEYAGILGYVVQGGIQPSELFT